MLALAIVIALLGIGNTLALAVHGRTVRSGCGPWVPPARRFAPRCHREAVLTAVLGTGTGALTGLFLGWALVTSVRVTAAGAPGAVALVTIPWPQVVLILLAGAAAGLLAGARPHAGPPGWTRSGPSPSSEWRVRPVSGGSAERSEGLGEGITVGRGGRHR